MRLVMTRLPACAARPDDGCACRAVAARRQTDGYGRAASTRGRRLPGRSRAPRPGRSPARPSRPSASSRGAAGSHRPGTRRARSSSARLLHGAQNVDAGDKGAEVVRRPTNECKDAAWRERDDTPVRIDSMFLCDAPEADPVLDAVLEPCELDASKLAHGASPSLSGNWQDETSCRLSATEMLR
jgi:hypothetical protein